MGSCCCSPRVAVPGRSICLLWRRSSKWRLPSSLSFIPTRMDIGGSSASPPDSTPSRTGNSFNQTLLDFIKGHFNAICAFSGTVIGTDLSLTDVNTVDMYTGVSFLFALLLITPTAPNTIRWRKDSTCLYEGHFYLHRYLFKHSSDHISQIITSPSLHVYNTTTKQVNGLV